MKVRKVTTERQQQKLNVAAYARVSTLSEEQEESFDTQVEYYTAYIQSVDEWNFVDVYADQLWEKVQQVLAEPRTVFENCKSHYLRGKVICANCGEVFMRTTRKKKSGKYRRWICKGHLASSGCKNQLMWEVDLLAHIEKKLGASDKETCEQIDKILIYPDGRVEIETK